MNWKYILIVFALVGCQKAHVNLNEGFDNSDYFIYKRTVEGVNSYYIKDQIFDSVKTNWNTTAWNLNDLGTTNILDLNLCSSNLGLENFEIDLDSLIIDQEYSSEYLVNYNAQIIVDGVLYEQAMFGFLTKWEYGQSVPFKTMKLELITQNETITYYFQSWQ